MTPLPLLFLLADTGGGHRSAAMAVSQALEQRYPGRFAPVLVDPLGGPSAPRRLRWPVALYGPCIRVWPALWGFLWGCCNTPSGLTFWRRTLFRPADKSVADAVTACQPAGIVAFHAMTALPAVKARDRLALDVPVITVVTDLVTAHLSWRDAGSDVAVVPSAAMGRCFRRDGIGPDRCVEIGLPVPAQFAAGPLPEHQRAALRRSLGLGGRFLVVVTGGAEGSGRIFRQVAALVRHVPEVDVVAICGRNRPLRRRLARLAARAEGRLTVRGLVGNMADWLRCADVVVSKAGPATIAEAAACAVPMVLTSHVPGQEEGNTEFVVAAGAGLHVGRAPELAAEIGRLRGDPAALAAMRAAAARLGRPAAAAQIADLLAGLTDRPGRVGERGHSAPAAVHSAEADLDVEPAFGLGTHGQRGAVRVGDGADDGQAQAVAIAIPGANTAEPLERLEQSLDLARRYFRPRVGYPQSGLAGDAHR
jgi:1,2-diacylglycerol 3-beta-galactosyltransferase